MAQTKWRNYRLIYNSLKTIMKLDLEKKYEAVNLSGEAAEMSLGDLLSFGDKTLLYFYPKDNTPGCTLENKDFSCLSGEFKKLGITVI